MVQCQNCNQKSPERERLCPNCFLPAQQSVGKQQLITSSTNNLEISPKVLAYFKDCRSQGLGMFWVIFLGFLPFIGMAAYTPVENKVIVLGILILFMLLCLAVPLLYAFAGPSKAQLRALSHLLIQNNGERVTCIFCRELEDESTKYIIDIVSTNSATGQSSTVESFKLDIVSSTGLNLKYNTPTSVILHRSEDDPGNVLLEFDSIAVPARWYFDERGMINYWARGEFLESRGLDEDARNDYIQYAYHLKTVPKSDETAARVEHRIKCIEDKHRKIDVDKSSIGP